MQVLDKSMRFTIRDGSSTLGYGLITDLLPDMDVEKYDAERKKEKKAKEKAEKDSGDAGTPKA